MVWGKKVTNDRKWLLCILEVIAVMSQTDFLSTTFTSFSIFYNFSAFCLALIGIFVLRMHGWCSGHVGIGWHWVNNEAGVLEIGVVCFRKHYKDSFFFFFLTSMWLTWHVHCTDPQRPSSVLVSHKPYKKPAYMLRLWTNWAYLQYAVCAELNRGIWVP